MSQPLSCFEVDCYKCGKKVRTLGSRAECGHCGCVMHLESWQVEHTMLPDGRVVKTGGKKWEL
jgi:hypothetical protein